MKLKGPPGTLYGLIYTAFIVLVASGLFMGLNLVFDIAIAYPRLSALYWTVTAVVVSWCYWCIYTDLKRWEATKT